ncbi:MAG: EboA domain-containing protein [Myxococcota bacterium]
MGDGQSVVDALVAVVANHAEAAQQEWLQGTMGEIAGNPVLTKVRVAIARAARKLKSEAVALAGDASALPPGPDYGRWTLRDFGRAALVLTACDALPAEDQLTTVEALIRRSEAGEQVSLLRMALLLPEPARFTPVLIDACRTNSLDVFEAIACENPYVAQHFPEANYNQVVLKAMFMEVAVERIVGLAERVNPEMVRMASDFGDERRAAARSIPEDIERITALAKAKST